MSGKILTDLGHVPTPWTVTVAEVGLTNPWGLGLLLYYYCFLITIIFINITTAAAATIGWTKIENEDSKIREKGSQITHPSYNGGLDGCGGNDKEDKNV